MPTERERKRERPMSKIFCNCVGDLVVWQFNKAADILVFLLLWYK